MVVLLVVVLLVVVPLVVVPLVVVLLVVVLLVVVLPVVVFPRHLQFLPRRRAQPAVPRLHCSRKCLQKWND